ncbi:MAG: starch-binding protein [Prevotella sp.]|nr:starch-binding protein [Prevotella sp.]
MKRFYTFLTGLMLLCQTSLAQGWPTQYDGVMLQGFYWDSYTDTQWNNLEAQADELAEYFDLIWVPNSAYAGSLTMNMGYHPVYWFDHKSAFGTEASLRSMIKTFREKGTGIIEDVVINHRLGVKSWTDFPAETVNGVTYQLTPNDICSDDEAASNGYQVGPNKDTGGNWGGARDLDHMSENVQKNVIAYLDYLKNDLGYVGFRYDYVLGYAPRYTAIYNKAVQPEFSVGECWESLATIKNWVNGTKVDGVIQSAAFDFPMKNAINSAFGDLNWAALGNSFLTTETGFNRYSVTFVDNHDTGRSAGEGGMPLYANVEAANAFILAMPGTPCVWLSHWKSNKTTIKKLVLARKAVGLTNESQIVEKKQVSGGYMVTVQGKNGNVRFYAGAPESVDTEGYKLAIEGANFKYYVSSSVDISALDNVKDDSENFEVPDFCKLNEGETAAFFEAPQTWTSTIKCWAWDSKGNYTGGSWPGTACTLVGTAKNGNKVYKWTWNNTYTGTTAGQPTYIIFSNNGSPQTTDKPYTNGGYYNFDGLQGTVTGIGNTVAWTAEKPAKTYTLQGQCIENPTAPGIYVKNGRKLIVR